MCEKFGNFLELFLRIEKYWDRGLKNLNITKAKPTLFPTEFTLAYNLEAGSLKKRKIMRHCDSIGKKINAH